MTFAAPHTFSATSTATLSASATTPTRPKFAGPHPADQLIATHPHPLVEGNTWHDQFWGDCRCDRCPGQGDNMLGVVLMGLRNELRSGPT